MTSAHFVIAYQLIFHRIENRSVAQIEKQYDDLWNEQSSQFGLGIWAIFKMQMCTFCLKLHWGSNFSSQNL